MDKGTIIRTLTALIIAIIDLARVLTGIEIHIAQDEVMTLVTVAVGIWIWWKNNSFTPEAVTADKIMKQMKATKDISTDIVDEPEDAEVK